MEGQNTKFFVPQPVSGTQKRTVTECSINCIPRSPPPVVRDRPSVGAFHDLDAVLFQVIGDFDDPRTSMTVVGIVLVLLLVQWLR